MEANKYFDDIKKSMESSIENFTNLSNKLSQMMPESLPKKAKVKGEIVTVTLQVNGAVTIEFNSKKKGEEFYKSLK